MINDVMKHSGVAQGCQGCSRMFDIIGQLRELRSHYDRTHDWVADLAKDVSGVRSELGLIRESIAAFRGKVNIVIAIAGTAAAAFMSIAVKFMFAGVN